MVRPKIATKCVLILQECLNRCTTDKSYIKNGFIDIPEVAKAKQKGFTYLLTYLTRLSQNYWYEGELKIPIGRRWKIY